MPIVSSTYRTDAHLQRDGSRYVYERHVEDSGRVHEVIYAAAPGFDVDGRLALRAQQISDQLAEAEAQALMGDA